MAADMSPANAPAPAGGPDPAVVRLCLADLDPYGSHPASGALHDPLYQLLDGPDEGVMQQLRVALRAHRGHPATPRLRARLAPWLDEPPLILSEVLHEDAPLDPDVDPVAEVQRRLLAHRDTRRVLDTHIEGLEARSQALGRLADRTAAVAALLAVFALIGWLAAIGEWRLAWEEPPAVPQLSSPGVTPAATTNDNSRGGAP
jgi:AcrR family transcriptional regulator